MPHFQTSITVSVPATSANLGTGYDCLGLALTLRNQVRFRGGGNLHECEPGTEPALSRTVNIAVNGIDREKLPSDCTNLIAVAAEVLFRHIGRWPTQLDIEVESAIPVGSGLGSSSSAIVAGLVGANALVSAGLDDDALLDLAVALEGHPDNVAPALLGGLVLGVMSPIAGGRDQLITQRLSMPALTTIVVLPDFPLLTSEARALLPSQVSRADAIHNASRVGLLLLALTKPDLSLLPVAMDDRLHQPYRLPLIPGAEAALQAAYDAGAAGVALSGAGPSLIAFAPKDAARVEEAMTDAFATAGLTSRSWSLKASETGVVTQRR